MAVQTHEQDDPTKSGDVISSQIENEKPLSESPVESITPEADHVTAKTWLVIFVSLQD